jgi:acetolactate synthase-1/2/3 large subunit
MSALKHAVHHPRGPVHLSIPVDIQRGPMRLTHPLPDRTAFLQIEPSVIDLDAADKLCEILEHSGRPVILVGEGCGEAVDAIMRLVDATNALFISTPGGKGLVNPHHPSYRGVFGFAGHSSSESLLRSSPDVVLAFGTGFGEFSSGMWAGCLLNERLVHVDSREDNLTQSPMARLHVRGRILAICTHVLRSMKVLPRAAGEGMPALACDPAAANVSLDSPLAAESSAAPIKPQRLMFELSRRFPPNTRFLADAGNSMTWAVHYLQPRNRRTARSQDRLTEVRKDVRSGNASWLRVTMDFASMGWAIGAAVGVARGNPECPVVCITGDGSYLMSGQEITVARAEGLCVIFVVLNDSAYGMVMHGQRMAGAEQIGYELPQVDYRLMAIAMGIPGHVIDSPPDFDKIDFNEILSRKGPTMLDVRIDREEVPPMLQRLKALGSAR